MVDFLRLMNISYLDIERINDYYSIMMIDIVYRVIL